MALDARRRTVFDSYAIHSLRIVSLQKAGKDGRDGLKECRSEGAFTEASHCADEL